MKVEQLTGSRCTTCDARYFPALSICPSCFARDLEPYALATSGRLHSYTVVHIAPAGRKAPYALGYVDLKDGVRVLALLLDYGEGLDCDSEMALVGRDRNSDVVAYVHAADREVGL